MIYKLKKLTSRPIKFLINPWLLTSNRSEHNKTVRNLFVISHLGQLAQIEEIIHREKLLDCALIILYTRKNLKMPHLVKEEANKSLFKQIFLLRIPNLPNKIHIKNLIKTNNTYKKIIDELKPSKLFILSFEKHYALLANYAKHKGCLVNLVEEGTATYKYDDYQQAISAVTATFSKEEKRNAFLIKTLPLFKEIRPALGIFRDFHTLYAVNPQALSNVFNASKYQEFFLYENIQANQEDIKIQQKYNISNQDIIFLNQRYPFPMELYAKNLISVLVAQFNPQNGQKIFIKLHPKDSEELKNKLKQEIITKGYQEKIVLIEQSSFLIEGLISLSKPKYIVSLTSTGLVYGNKISPETSSISIYPKLKSALLKSISYSDSVFKESDEHYHILTKFKNVSFIE